MLLLRHQDGGDAVPEPLERLGSLARYERPADSNLAVYDALLTSGQFTAEVH